MDPNLKDALVKDGYTSEEISHIEKEDYPQFSLRYQDHSYKVPYRQRRGQFKTTIHWGQRKLLLSCIQFLTKYQHLASRVVYAGAAPGTNILILSELFPKHEFFLYDPRPFDEDLADHPKIHLFQEYFTDDVARSYKDKKVLFWSDIRTGSLKDDDFEEQIVMNNKMQEKWHYLMRPEYAMYKFRLPYKAGHTKYMRGQIWLQIWAPETSTETRLVVRKNPSTKVYSHSKYEKRLFYFNLITRQWGHYPTYYCQCYDCCAEAWILSKYLNNPNEKVIHTFSESISKALSATKTIYDVPHNIQLKAPMFKKYLYIRKTKDVVLDRRLRKIQSRVSNYHKNITRNISNI